MSLKSQMRITKVVKLNRSSKNLPMKTETSKLNSKPPKKRSIMPNTRSVRQRKKRLKLKNILWRFKDTTRLRYKKPSKQFWNKRIRKMSLRGRKLKSILNMSKRRPI